MMPGMSGFDGPPASSRRRQRGRDAHRRDECVAQCGGGRVGGRRRQVHPEAVRAGPPDGDRRVAARQGRTNEVDESLSARIIAASVVLAVLVAGVFAVLIYAVVTLAAAAMPSSSTSAPSGRRHRERAPAKGIAVAAGSSAAEPRPDEPAVLAGAEAILPPQERPPRTELEARAGRPHAQHLDPASEDLDVVVRRPRDGTPPQKWRRGDPSAGRRRDERRSRLRQADRPAVAGRSSVTVARRVDRAYGEGVQAPPQPGVPLRRRAANEAARVQLALERRGGFVGREPECRGGRRRLRRRSRAERRLRSRRVDRPTIRTPTRPRCRRRRSGRRRMCGRRPRDSGTRSVSCRERVLRRRPGTGTTRARRPRRRTSRIGCS